MVLSNIPLSAKREAVSLDAKISNYSEILMSWNIGHVQSLKQKKAIFVLVVVVVTEIIIIIAADMYSLLTC